MKTEHNMVMSQDTLPHGAGCKLALERYKTQTHIAILYGCQQPPPRTIDGLPRRVVYLPRPMDNNFPRNPP